MKKELLIVKKLTQYKTKKGKMIRFNNKRVAVYPVSIDKIEGVTLEFKSMQPISNPVTVHKHRLGLTTTLIAISDEAALGLLCLLNEYFDK